MGPECRACVDYQRWVDLIFKATELDHTGLYHALHTPGIVPRIDETVRTALRETLADISRFHPTGIPAWKDVHRAYFPHLTTLDRFARDKWIFTPGGNQTVNPGIGDWKDGYFTHRHGASHRLLVEMTDPPTGYLAFPGMSTDVENPPLDEPGSPWMRWRDCKLDRIEFPVDWNRLQTEALEF
jgi:hypothetical protein